jgi:hypothetical protein
MNKIEPILATTIALVIIALALPSQAAMWDVGKIITGDNVIPSAGGPWIDDEGKIYFGAGKDFSFGYEATYDKLFLNGTSAGLYFNTGGDITFYTADPTNDSINFGTYPITAAGLAGFTDTDYGLTESAGEARINLSSNMGLEFGTGSRAGALQIKRGDPSIDLGADGIEVGSGNFLMNVIAGGAAGNHTLTGCAVGDEIIGVAYFAKPGYNLTAVSDLTSEFSILDTNVVENAGHTDTASGYLLINWLDRTA